jgi:hypothetical protein
MDSSDCPIPRGIATHSRDSVRKPPGNLKIWNAAEIAANGIEESMLKTLLDWILTVIVRPHSELGRTGPVCPFVMPALQLQCLWISVVDWDVGVEDISEIIRSFIDIYHSYQPNVGAGAGLRTFLIAFPALDPDSAGSTINAVHSSLKPEVVERGLMLGEFFPHSTSPGVHNPKYFPLRSPVPVFVIRKMVTGDLVFLNKQEDPVDRRLHYLRSYLNCLADELSAERVDEVKGAIGAALAINRADANANRSVRRMLST